MDWKLLSYLVVIHSRERKREREKGRGCRTIKGRYNFSINNFRRFEPTRWCADECDSTSRLACSVG